jgi:hypothetical protein
MPRSRREQTPANLRFTLYPIMPITPLLQATCSTIRLTGGIDAPKCWPLINEMKLLHNNFPIQTIEPQSDRPGAQAP